MSEQRNIIIDNIDFSEALRYLGYGNSTPDEKTKEILYNCADQLGHDHSQIYDYTSTAKNRLLTLGGWPSMEGHPSPVYFETCPYQRRSP